MDLRAMRRTISREHRAAVVVADLRGRAAVVNWNGQSWLARGGAVSLSGATISALPGIGVEQSFAIGQRALLIRKAGGCMMWDCVT